MRGALLPPPPPPQQQSSTTKAKRSQLDTRKWARRLEQRNPPPSSMSLNCSRTPLLAAFPQCALISQAPSSLQLSHFSSNTGL